MRETLRDGSRVAIRPIEPEDRAALLAGFERLSPESRYRRFFGPMPHLSERDLDYLTNVDHRDHEALVAVEDDSGEGVGVARFVRIGPEAAEPAIAVVDDWQGRGVGTLLLERLADRAREEGIRRFEAPVLATNPEGVRVLERLGDATTRLTGREVEVVVDLPAEPSVRPGWRDVLRQSAIGALEPARSLLERAWPWPHRRGAPGDERRNLIVVGTDGSAHAATAVQTAAALAEATGAEVAVVGVHRFLPPDAEQITEAVHAAAGDLRARGLRVREHVRRGDAPLVLTDLAADERARLIVVGAGERGGLTRRVMGSVADFVAERAPCDVLIVRPRAPEGEAGASS